MTETVKVGRPRKEIDFAELEKLCQLQCTREEICGWFDVSDETLSARCRDAGYDNFLAYYKKHSQGGKISLRRSQFRIAEKNAAMAIWLGKQYLGQRDIPDAESEMTEKIIEQIEIIE